MDNDENAATEEIEQTLSPETLKAFIRKSNTGGRHPALTQKTLRRLLNALSDGLTQRQACVVAGINEATFYKYKSNFPDLEALIEQAREKARQKALAIIKAAGEAGDWRAAESFLKHSFQGDYSPKRETTHNITTNVNTAIGICNEEQRARLIEQRRRLLATTAPSANPARLLTTVADRNAQREEAVAVEAAPTFDGASRAKNGEIKDAEVLGEEGESE
jgi:hypothetical protein